ncbi:MAG: type I pullulanase, partial [Clostridiales bacterium]|nr:type I pullulanase [Clostridiales bacterium]
IVNNKVTIYLVNGYEEIYYNVEEPDLSTHFKEAKFNCMKIKDKDTYRVQIETGSAKLVETTKLKIIDSTGAVQGTLDCSDTKNAALVGNNTANIDFTGTFDFAETYTLVDESTDDQTRFATATINKVALYDNETAFTSKYNYEGTLGAEYSKAQTKFTVWSPAAKEVKLNIYAAGEGGVAQSYDMTKGEKGTWTYTLSGDQNGKYYTYTVGNKEIVDPYARSAGRNGTRGMILDLDSTDPEGWETHSRPAKRGSYTNAIIYEMHIRDISIHESSNVSAANRGKFLGLTEKASEDNGNKKTPLDYIKELGVTEVHILPMFDFATVNETFNEATFDGENQYNWGYDPLNYNVP